MTGELDCSVCGESSSSFFMTIGTASICIDCSKKSKGKIPQFQKPQTFTRYICKTHNCGTYNVGKMYNTHEMKDCVIIEQVTLGIIRPATFGGLNGDIGRGHFLGVNEIVRLVTNLANYKRFAFIHIKNRSNYNSKKLSYPDKKYYNKHLRYLPIMHSIDYHKSDEYLMKLKFNLNMYISTMPKRARPVIVPQAVRAKMYYSNLMKDFSSQVIKK